MQVRLLGPVDVMVDGAPQTVPGLRRRAVLATLALRAGEVVGTDQLIDAVWGTAVPSTAANTLQSHVSYLRHLLPGKSVIVARPPGYVLDVGEGGTDVLLAERLLRQGTQASDPAEGVRQLREAAALWRGRSLANVTGLVWLEGQAERLDVLQLTIKRALAQARLTTGEHAQLLPELEQLRAEHPLDEQIRAQLMLALCTGAAGRRTRWPRSSGCAPSSTRSWAWSRASRCGTWRSRSCARTRRSTWRPDRWPRRPVPASAPAGSAGRDRATGPADARAAAVVRWPGSPAGSAELHMLETIRSDGRPTRPR